MASSAARILFVNSIPADVMGGGEKWMLTAATELQKRGHEIKAMVRGQSKIANAFAAAAVDVVPMQFGADFNPAAILRIYRHLRRIRPQAMVMNFNKDVSIAGVAGRLARVPRLVFRNGFPILNNKRKHRLLLPFFDVLLCNAKRIRDRYTQYGWGLEQRTHIIYNGISMPARTMEKSRRDASTFVIAGIGRLAKTKRFDLLLRVVAELQKSQPVQAILAGEGDEREALQQLAKSLTVKVQFAGHVEVSSILQNCDALMHPSANEGMPNVVMEAMAARVPVIASNAGDTAELIPDARFGYLCPVDDEKAFVDACKSLIENPQEVQRMVDNAAARIESEFSLQQSIDRLEALLLPT